MKPEPAFVIGPQAGSVREVLSLATPLMVSSLSQSMMWVVDTLIMGQVGTEEQGAVGLAGVLFWAVICFFCGTLNAVNILVAQNFGAGETSLSRHVRTGLLLVVPMTALMAACWFLVPFGLSAMHVSEAVRPHAQTYIQVRLYAAPFVLTSVVLTNYLRGVGNTFSPMLVVLAANVLNAVLAMALVFGWMGLPMMGVAGAALATAVAGAAECVTYLGIYFFGAGSRAHGSRKIQAPSRREVMQFLALGLPIGLAWLFETMSWTAFSVYAGSRPPSELAAHTILFQVTGFCFMPAISVGVAASTLVGQYLGARRPDLVRKSAWSSLVLGVGYMGAVGLILAVVRFPLVGAFNANQEVLLLGAELALLAAFYQPFDGIGIVAQGVLRGAGRTWIPTAVVLASGVFVFIPLVWFLGEHQGMGIRGAWTAAVIHVVIVGVALALLMWGGKLSFQLKLGPSSLRLGAGSALDGYEAIPSSRRLCKGSALDSLPSAMPTFRPKQEPLATPHPAA